MPREAILAERPVGGRKCPAVLARWHQGVVRRRIAIERQARPEHAFTARVVAEYRQRARVAGESRKVERLPRLEAVTRRTRCVDLQ